MNRGNRLRGRRLFAAVRARRIVAGSGPLRVHAAPSDQVVARVGFVIPRAVGGAVVRNRMRRRLRAALSPRLSGLAGVDLVVVARPGVAELTSAALVEHLERCLAAVAPRSATTHQPQVEDNGGSGHVARAARLTEPLPA